MEKNIMVISAHPDDLDFACCGTIAKFVKEGANVVYVIISDGARGGSDSNISEVRAKEQEEAAKFVGVDNVIFLGIKDGCVENNDSLRKRLVELIRTHKPNLVFTFDPDITCTSVYLYHSDHRNTAQVVFDAVYPRANNKDFYPELNLPLHYVGEFYFFGGKEPNTFIDISDFFDLKIKALMCHKSQFENHEEIKKYIEQWSRENGGKINVKYAEAFRNMEDGK